MSCQGDREGHKIMGGSCMVLCVSGRISICMTCGGERGTWQRIGSLLQGGWRMLGVKWDTWQDGEGLE